MRRGVSALSMVEISPEVQRELAREAEIRGIAVPALAASLLEEAVARPPCRAKPSLAV